MRFGYKATILLLMLSLLFACLSLPVSGALSQTKINRPATAQVSSDNTAMIDLIGFNSQYYDFDNKYSNFGIITNNTNQKMTITISVKVSFPANVSKNCILSFRIGNNTIFVRNDSSHTGEITITLSPLQSVDAQVYLDRNQNSLVTASFDITAENTQGDFVVQMNDTTQSPRRIYCY